MSNDAISQAIVKLFDRQRFYAEVLAQMKRVIGTRVPIAGVCIKNQIELHINPKTFNQLTLDERVAVLMHECEHILRNHIGRSKEIAPEVYQESKEKDGKEKQIDNIINQAKHSSINIAADCAINYSLNNLPEGAIFPHTFDLPNGETMEWYLENLKNNEKAKNFMEIDGHPLWAESEGDKDILKEKIRQAANKAASKARAVGCMSSDDELILSELNKGQTLNWKQQLKRFAAKTIESKIESSKKKRNRRYGIVFPGNIKVEDLHIGVAIDTSGSVSDEALKQFMREIGHIAKFAKVTVVEADAEIKKSYIYKPSKTYKISGRGGTAYKPAFDFFSKEEIDGVIYFGDMDCFDTEELTKPKYPVLWAIVGDKNPPANFGSEVRVKVEA